ncbi:MAG: hypothetical protein H7A35_11785 [Planctomycetales bacterium]|nr:hypothetical protein [bacterium]UNM07539.1 MAG: hypothetical protein H7A35_11785 [Planctomycetales bacterium]
MNDSDSLRWLEIFGYGFMIWIVEILARVGLYGVQGYSDRAVVVILLIGLAVACLSTILYLPKCSGNRRLEGVVMGVSWVVICIGLDMLVFSSGMGRIFGYENFTPERYMARDGWIYLFLLIVGVAGGFLSHASDSVQRRAEGTKAVMDNLH